MPADANAEVNDALANAGAGAYDPNPRATPGFGAREDADATRQAQHQNANDTPVDVNPNAIVARLQASAFAAQQETLAQMGKNFEASAMRFNGLMSHFANVLAAAHIIPKAA